VKRRRNRRAWVALALLLAAAHVGVRAVYGVPSTPLITFYELGATALAIFMLASALSTVLELLDGAYGKDAGEIVTSAVCSFLFGAIFYVAASHSVVTTSRRLTRQPSAPDMMNPLDLPEPLRPRIER